MKRLLRSLSGTLLLAFTGLSAAHAADPVALPVQYRRLYGGESWLNYQSVAGVPISTTAGNPPGSNGNQPVGNESTGINTPPTEGQFQSLISHGAVAGLTFSQWQTVSNSATLNAGSTPFSGTVATEMQVKIRDSGVNPVSQLDPSAHIPADWPARALVWMCTPAANNWRGQEISLRDETIRRAVGLIR